MTTQFPPEAIAAIKSKPMRAFLCQPEAPVLGACQNCGGMGAIMLQFETLERGTGISMAFVGYERINVKGRTYPCPVCGTGDRLARQEFAWSISGLDSNERGWRVDYIRDMIGKENALSAAYNLLAQCPEPVGVITLFGDYGRGKTGLLKSLTAQFTLAGVTARYCRAADMLSEIRGTYGENTSEDTEQAILNRVGSVRFLAVDEVDRIPSTDWAMSTMMLILDTRYARRDRCATVIATNQHPDELGQQWGYLSSRLRDGVRVPIGGDDLRG